MHKTISPKQASELLANGELDVIDVRDPHEFQDGHLPGSRLIPLASFRRDPAAALSGRPVLFVCAAGIRSETASRLAATSSAQQVYNLAGGTRAWVRAGLVLEHEHTVSAAE